FEQMRTVLPGNHAVYALLNARLSELSRRAGLLQEGETHRLDGASQALELFGEDHPYAALLAMEHARNAQAAHDHHTAAVEIARALDIRWRLLGLSEIATRRGRRVDVARLERLSPVSSAPEDRDGDGLLDLLEGAVGLDSTSSDSDRDGTLDDDEDLDGDGV